MTKRKDAAHEDGKTVRSPEEGAPPHEWTEEEMRQAKAFPLPAVAPEKLCGVKSGTASVKGETSEGGRPEKS